MISIKYYQNYIFLIYVFISFVQPVLLLKTLKLIYHFRLRQLIMYSLRYGYFALRQGQNVGDAEHRRGF